MSLQIPLLQLFIKILSANSKPSAATAGSFGQRAQSAGQPPHPSSGRPSCRSSGRLSRPNTNSSGTTLIGNVTVSLTNNTSRNSIVQSGVDSDSKRKFLPAFPETYWKKIDEHKDRISGDSGRCASHYGCCGGRGGRIQGWNDWSPPKTEEELRTHLRSQNGMIFEWDPHTSDHGKEGWWSELDGPDDCKEEGDQAEGDQAKGNQAEGNQIIVINHRYQIFRFTQQTISNDQYRIF